jgi:hypothetical protein
VKKNSNAGASHSVAQVEAHASKPAFALKRMSVFMSYSLLLEGAAFSLERGYRSSGHGPHFQRLNSLFLPHPLP